MTEHYKNIILHNVTFHGKKNKTKVAVGYFYKYAAYIVFIIIIIIIIIIIFTIIIIIIISFIYLLFGDF